MTLGKVERFGKTIYEEFLVRTQFGSFEEAQKGGHDGQLMPCPAAQEMKVWPLSRIRLAGAGFKLP
jgi:hypothetical protein